MSKKNLECGDHVAISEDSQFYTDQYSHGVGKITERSPSGWFTVRFPDDYSNSYRTKDLDYVSPEDINTVHNRIQTQKAQRTIIRGSCSFTKLAQTLRQSKFVDVRVGSVTHGKEVAKKISQRYFRDTKILVDCIGSAPGLPSAYKRFTIKEASNTDFKYLLERKNP